MRFIIGLLLSLVVAAFVGLGATLLALTNGIAFGAFTIGSWTAWLKNGTAEIDPYARAAIARSGELPTGLGDGVAFFAHADDNGKPLDGRCDVIVSGSTPQARYWTITLYDTQGQLIGNPINRQGFTSQEIIRKLNGDFEIEVSPRARAGNWLPTGGIARYVLLLRLYDTPIGVTTRAGREVNMPSIVTSACP
ncbi:MAG TPA: DUF1214 domain-containing protein [Pseudorhodoplanes sp.]|nr:DUF1214 domain-containing protein [Pseudorhodoplanes sp.]